MVGIAGPSIIGHQAIAEEAGGIAVPGLRDRLEKRGVIVVVAKQVRAVVAAIERVVDQAVSRRQISPTGPIRCAFASYTERIIIGN
jgi:hypothetical protein